MLDLTKPRESLWGEMSNRQIVHLFRWVSFPQLSLNLFHDMRHYITEHCWWVVRIPLFDQLKKDQTHDES